MDGVNYTVGAATPYSWGVVRDNAGRITQKVENIGVDTVTWDYTYDLMGRLETVTKDGVLAESYTYDGQGNRLSEVNNLRNVTRSYTNSVEDHTLTAGADSYSFDVDGFLTSRSIASGAYSGTATFDYSSRGELLSASLPTGDTITYQHDPMGRRIAKRVNGVIKEKYLWADSTILLAVYDGSDTLVQRFEYADGRMPVSMVYNVNVYYLAYDQVGSLRAVTGSAGTVVKRVEYDSFGNILSDSNQSFTVPFGFAGGLQDRGRATGPHLHFAMYRNGRYVDPRRVNVPRASSVPRDEMESYMKVVDERTALFYGENPEVSARRRDGPD